MRARRTAAIWALLAFVLGTALGPVLGVERQTVVVDGSISPRRLPSMAADGWTVARSDVASSNVRLVTFERPRLIGIARSASEAFNNAAGWLAWATNKGVYSRR